MKHNKQFSISSNNLFIDRHIHAYVTLHKHHPFSLSLHWVSVARLACLTATTSLTCIPHHIWKQPLCTGHQAVWLRNTKLKFRMRNGLVNGLANYKTHLPHFPLPWCQATFCKPDSKYTIQTRRMWFIRYKKVNKYWLVRSLLLVSQQIRKIFSNLYFKTT